MTKKILKNGAGGTSGGIEEFIISIAMIFGGGYLLLNSIIVKSMLSMKTILYSYGGYNLTSGYILIPLIFGIFMIFNNARSLFGWLLTFGSLTGLIFGVLTSLRITFKTMSMFDLACIIVLLFGGLGLFLKSLREHKKNN